MECRGYLCKKRPGDIINKYHTQREAVRKLSVKNKKLQNMIDDVETCACSESILLFINRDHHNEFLSKRPELSESINGIAASHIEGCLAKLPFLQGIEESKLGVLAAMCQYEALDADKVVFEENSLGSKFYIVLSGVAIVLAGTSESGTELERSLEHSCNDSASQSDSVEGSGAIFLAELTNGDYFGETALFIKIPRTTTVKTKKKCLFVTVDKTAFENFLKVCPIKESMMAVMKERILSKISSLGIPFLYGIPDQTLKSLQNSAKIHETPDGKVIFQEGDAGDRFYIIVHGEVSVGAKYINNGEDGETDERKVATGMKSLGVLQKGSYFGEMALVSESPRRATVTSKGRSVLLSIDKENFHNVFGRNSHAISEFNLRLLQENAELHHLLAHSVGESYFRTFLKNERADENIDFWTKVRDFKDSSFRPENDRDAAAKDIYEAFCSENSERQVNLPCTTRVGIAEHLESGKVKDCIFDKAQAEVYKLMVRDSYARYKASPGFKEFFKSLGV